MAQLRPSFLPLFTGVRGRVILGSPLAGFWIGNAIGPGPGSFPPALRLRVAARCCGGEWVYVVADARFACRRPLGRSDAEARGGHSRTGPEDPAGGNRGKARGIFEAHGTRTARTLTARALYPCSTRGTEQLREASPASSVPSALGGRGGFCARLARRPSTARAAASTARTVVDRATDRPIFARFAGTSCPIRPARSMRSMVYRPFTFSAPSVFAWACLQPNQPPRAGGLG